MSAWSEKNCWCIERFTNDAWKTSFPGPMTFENAMGYLRAMWRHTQDIPSRLYHTSTRNTIDWELLNLDG